MWVKIDKVTSLAYANSSTLISTTLLSVLNFAPIQALYAKYHTIIYIFHLDKQAVVVLEVKQLAFVIIQVMYVQISKGRRPLEVMKKVCPNAICQRLEFLIDNHF